MRIDKERVGQCFFGEHLLAEFPDLPVGIVESEKSAIIASFYLPGYVWLACGGKDGMFGKANLDIFKDRKVVLFPDLGMKENWEGKAERLRRHGIEAHVFTYTPPKVKRRGDWTLPTICLMSTHRRPSSG